MAMPIATDFEGIEAALRALRSVPHPLAIMTPIISKCPHCANKGWALDDPADYVWPQVVPMVVCRVCNNRRGLKKPE